MFEIGASLAAARRARKLTLADAEALTCIRAKQLEALEAERYEQLPGRAYARAFLRTYAKALGLDAETFAAEFDERFPEPDDALELPERRRRRPRRMVPLGVGVGVVATVALLIVGWVASRPTTTPPLALQSLAQTRRPAPVAHRRHVDRRPVDRRLVVRAARGACWLLVRKGSATGPVLYEGTLSQGSVARFAAPRVWMRLGAPSMVDVSRGSRRLQNLPALPTNVVA